MEIILKDIKRDLKVIFGLLHETVIPPHVESLDFYSLPLSLDLSLPLCYSPYWLESHLKTVKLYLCAKGEKLHGLKSKDVRECVNR